MLTHHNSIAIVSANRTQFRWHTVYYCDLPRCAHLWSSDHVVQIPKWTDQIKSVCTRRRADVGASGHCESHIMPL